MDPVLRALVSRNHRRLVRALRGLSEAERRRLVPELSHPGGTDGAYELALLGTGSLGQIRRGGAWDLSLVADADIADVLLDRRPSWLASWAAWILRAELLEPKWPAVRRLVREGAIERPDDARYFDGLLATSRAYGNGARMLLRSDRALLDDDVWDLVALGGGRDDSLTAADGAGAGWADALAAQAPRARLLDVLLSALAGDLIPYRASWYTKLWRELRVSAAERAERVDALAALLGAAAAPVVGFAIAELALVDPLPPGIDLGPPLASPAKKTVRAALKLLDRAGGPPVAATLALTHQAADIQGEALARLERWGLDDGAREALRDALPVLAATQRPRAEALLAAEGGEGAGAGERRVVSAEATQLDARVAALPAEIRSALNFGGPLPPAPVLGEPVLGEPVAPIESLDELVEAIAAHIAEPWYVRDERIMDALLRRCDQPFPAELQPFAPTLRELGDYAGGVLHVAAAWLTGTPATSGRGTAIERIVAACARSASGQAAPLLALPTHAGGWIAAGALVERVRAVGDDADEVELAQALLRLAPDGRDAALAAADDLPGRAGAIVRCALGGPEVPDDGAAALAARASREPPLTRVSIEVDGVEIARQPSGALEGPLGEYLVTATGENEPHGRFANDPLAWPLRRDILCAGLFWAVAFNLGRGAPEYHAAARYLELLTREGEPLPPLALTLAIRALCSSSAPEHLSAADLLIAAIEDGRVDAPALVPILREELPRVMPNRLGPRLADVAGAGPLQRAVVRDVLDATVDAMAALPPRRTARCSSPSTS